MSTAITFEGISILIPVYNEAGQISVTIARIQKVLETNGLAHEILVVDDGSSDGTWDELVRLSCDETRLRAVRLSRNFGKEAALCAGLQEVRGPACIILDADLQHPPEIIPEMVRLWRENGFPIVEAHKRSRGKEGAAYRWAASLFYKTLRSLSTLDLENASDFKLLDSRIIEIWRGLKERETFFRGLTAWVGFPRGKVFFDVPERETGRSRWSKWTLLRLAISALTSFSSAPLQAVTSLGVLFLLGAAPLLIQTLYMKLSGRAVDGFTTVIILQLIIGSILMISLGVIGTYLARVFDEVKQRPRYLISDRTGTKPVTTNGA